MKQTRWIGQTLNGRYKIEDLLGQGGMSAVYKATDPNLRRVVAIKIVHPHLSTDPSFIRRFEEEAAAIASLRHPNIVQVFDFNSDEDVNYMVMEFVPGETLQTRLKRLNSKERKMSFEDAINITINVCEGLSYAHKRGMVHRDVKPANIMLDINNQAILMDFGIVKIVGSSAHTLTGAVIGTANYMAPEIIRSEPADQRSDIYSLGITLFEMLSGSPPFDADSAMTIMMMHLNDPLPNLFSIRNDIPYDLIQIVNKTLAKDRNDRYQSADDFAKDLRRILQQPQTNEIQIPVDPIKERKIENEEQPTMVFNSSQSSLEDVTMIDHSDRNIVEDVTVVDFSAEALSDEVVQDTLVEIPKKTIDSYDPKSGKQKKIIGVILALVLIGVSMIGFFTSWFGLGGEKQVIEKPQPTQQQANSITQNNSQLTLSALTVMSTARAETVKKTENPQIIPAQKFKVCQLTDMGSIYDSAFQETVYNGILNAKESFGINVEVLESSNEADYENNLAIFVESKCDLIVSSGYLLGDITLSFVQAHPEIYFSVVDFDFEGNYHNLVCQVYQIDEAAFLAGYLAARMTETGKVATYGGMPLQPVKLFMDGFTRGVDYYNRVKGTNVQVIGWEINDPDGGMFVNSFENMDLGVEIGNELINQNVDVIFPVAGQVGIGTAIVMRERKSGYIIGVDSDWAITNPELAPVILTSVLKNTNITTYEIIKKSLEGQFEAGKYVGSLNNDGVSLAPYYEMEQRIPVQIRNEIQEIREMIIMGEIDLSSIYKIK